MEGFVTAVIILALVAFVVWRIRKGGKSTASGGTGGGHLPNEGGPIRED